jgi:hypothetical protein
LGHRQLEIGVDHSDLVIGQTGIIAHLFQKQIPFFIEIRVIAYEIGVRKLSYGGEYDNGRECSWQDNGALWEGKRPASWQCYSA